MQRTSSAMVLLAVVAAGCGGHTPPSLPAPPSSPPAISRAAFGTTADGEAVETFTLRNANGIEMRVISLGGIVTHLTTPDRTGTMSDIVLGFDRLDGYLKPHPYF